MTLKAWQHKLKCAAGHRHRLAMKHRWRKAKDAFYEHRRRERRRIRVTPYPGAGQWWAVPFPIVVCESGVRGYVTSGYYGILVSTWEAFGGTRYAPTPGEAPKWAQDLIAHKLIVLYGLSPWECASITGLA